MSGKKSASKKHRLTDLVLSEVSLVDRPANPLATVVLFKRDSSEETIQMDELKKQLEQITAERDALKAEVETSKSALAKANTELATVTAERDEIAKKIQPEEKPVKLSPEAQAQIDKALKEASDAREALEKMQDEQQTAVYVAKAHELKALAQDPKTFGPILKRIAQNKATAEDRVELEKVLEKANDAIAKALKPSGDDQGSSSAAADRLDSLAKAKAEKEGIPFAKAYADVTKANPELYTQYLAEQN